MKRAALICIVLAACGSVPQPFQGTAKVTSDIAILDVPSAVGIAILPITDLPEPLNGQLTSAVAKALESYEIPAEAVPANTGLGFTLTGKIIDRRDENGMVVAGLTWALTSRAGRPAGAYTQSLSMPLASWEQGETALANQLGRDAADVINEIIEGKNKLVADTPAAAPPNARQASAPTPLRVSVKPMEGAPGDGREALQIATLQSLLANNMKRDDANPEVVLAGQVSTQPTANGQEFVTISWRAITKDGQELGEAKLTNTIPRGSLDGRWGAAAFAIAEAGLPQIMELLSLAPRFTVP
ncbi:MAG: hypothetical protein EXR11_00935 [Rhodospirillaceae bacterium]|nr:hypothetical protein [Rhodospirillaceae bacterium]